MNNRKRPFVTNAKTAGAILRAAKAFDQPKVDGVVSSVKSGKTDSVSQATVSFRLISDWVRYMPFDGPMKGREIENTAYRAKAKKIIASEEGYVVTGRPEDAAFTIYCNDASMKRPDYSIGDQVWATKRGNRWELFDYAVETDPVGPKELFPVVYYEREQKDKNGVVVKDEKGKPVKDMWILCPGGNTDRGPTKRIYSLNLKTRTWSASEFSELPVAMSNFPAVVMENPHGEKELVCGNGFNTDVVENVPLQFYNFDQDVWRTVPFGWSFQGCAMFEGEDTSDGDKTAIIVGGQGAYYQSEKSPIYSGSGTTQFYGWTITPLWQVNLSAGSVLQKTPLRPMNYSESQIIEEKRFMKTNFKAIKHSVQEGTKKTDYIAFGGTETVSAFNNAVVSYNNDAFVDTVDYASRVQEKCVLYPNTPEVLGECCVEYADRVSNNNGGLQDVKRILCIAGRKRGKVKIEVERVDENGEPVLDNNGNPIIDIIEQDGFVLHDKIHWLTLSTKQWAKDFFPAIPIPRYNAGSILLKDVEREEKVDPDDPESETKTVKYDLLFLIGGRNNDGLLSDCDVLNITKNEWELDWPDFNNKVRPQEEDE